MNTTETQQRTFKDYLGLTARGFAMGSADVVPGVSGGTMAFILGIYEELINSIRDIASPKAVRLLGGFKIKQAFDELPWRFLLAVGIGILLAILSLARFLEYMLENQPVMIWSFFFGLVLASIITVSKRVKQWQVSRFVGLAIGAVAAYSIVGMVPLETPNAPWFLFFSGALAICAMILPGISGAFILVLLGKYEYVLSAVNDRDIVTILIVAAGAAVGIVTFAQILGWLFKRYHDVTVAVLMGFILGSLRKIWPWKETVEFIERHGERIPIKQINILPAAWTNEVTFALVLAIIGFGLVILLDYVASRKEEGPTAEGQEVVSSQQGAQN
jgi:putative membrane protein